MTKEQKNAVVAELADRFQQQPNFYLLDIMGMNVAANNNLRREFHKNGYRLTMVKNTLIQKALEKTGADHSDIFPALAQSSTLLFVKESGAEPAKLLKEFRKKNETELPLLKGAYIEGSAYLGNDQLDALTKVKGKTELLGELIGLLQSPAKNVVSALKSSGGKLAGILKTLEERGN